MLRERKGRIRKAGTIQTYWNTLTLVRQLETKQFEIAPQVQIEMCGVCRPGLWLARSSLFVLTIL
jgi:hypothetical protein